MENQIVPKLTLRQLAQMWQDCAQDVRTAYGLLVSVERRLDETFGGAQSFALDVHHPAFMHYEDPDRALRVLECRAWRGILDRLGVWEMLSLEGHKHLTRMLEERSVGRDTDTERLGPITEESLQSVLRGLCDAIPEQLTRAVGEIYSFLRPRTSKLKTNGREGLKDRIILERMCETNYRSGMCVIYHWQAELRLLDRVFGWLEGGHAMREAEARAGLVETIAQGGMTGETRYFRYKVYKNGNLHLQFARPDLVQRFNEIAGCTMLKEAPCR